MTHGANYTEVLRLIWAGNEGEAANIIGEALESETDPGRVALLYRAWIESLAAQGEKSALRELCEHMRHRGSVEVEHQGTFIGLRGIAHLELDELAGAKLLYRSVERDFRNAYICEFKLMLSTRLSKPLINFGVARVAYQGLQDYFSWQSLVRGMFMSGDKIGAHQTAEKISGIFPRSPILALFNYHQRIEEKDFKGAAIQADRLMSLIPSNREYQYLTAYAKYRDHRPEEALDAFGSMIHEVESLQDFDFVNLISQCFADRSKLAPTDLKRRDVAMRALQHTLSLGRAEGLPTTDIKASLETMTDDHILGVDQLVERGTRSWIAKITPELHCDIKSFGAERVSRIRLSMGGGARPGDLCFLAAPEPVRIEDQAKSWRIVAIYAVATEPTWHPIKGYETSLDLISRPTQSIPVDVEILDENVDVESAKLPKDHPFRYGMFELEDGALDLITAAIKQHNGERDVLGIAKDLDLISRAS